MNDMREMPDPETVRVCKRFHIEPIVEYQALSEKNEPWFSHPDYRVVEGRIEQEGSAKGAKFLEVYRYPHLETPKVQDRIIDIIFAIEPNPAVSFCACASTQYYSIMLSGIERYEGEGHTREQACANAIRAYSQAKHDRCPTPEEVKQDG